MMYPHSIHQRKRSPARKRINVKHPLVKKIKGSDENKEVKMLTQLLFDQALLSAGRPLDDPANFVKGINKLMFS